MSTTRLVVLVLAALAAAVGVTWFVGGETGETGETGDASGTPAEPAALAAPPPDAVIALLPSVHDHFRQAICGLVPGDGLSSFSTVIKASRENADHVLAVSLGDICTLRGPLGRHTTQQVIRDFVAGIGVNVLAAGTSELQHGSAFVRSSLATVPELHVLCANATDAEGRTLLRGWSAATTTDADGNPGRTVLFVAVAGESIQADLAEAGSDVLLAPPAPIVRQALADAAARVERSERAIDLRVLLVHGTEAEATAILETVPGFDLAAFADGPELPLREPRRVAGVPLVYPGARARFVNWVAVHGANPAVVEPNLSRLGRDLLTRGDRSRDVLLQMIRGLSLVARDALGGSASTEDHPRDPRGDYVGAEACAECHADIAERHERSAHRRPPAKWGLEATDGNPQCLPCHVTAPGWRGGYGGPADVTSRRGVSCEACHGPGADHAVMPGPGYGAVAFEDCAGCHPPDHSPGFDAAAEWARAGHGPR